MTGPAHGSVAVMADRPSGNGPDEGSAEYDWLYSKGRSAAGPGSGRRANPDDDATQAVGGGPDRTRMMPAVPRSGERPPARSRSGGPAAPPPATRPRRRRGRGLPRPRPRWILYALLLWLAYLLIVPVIAWNTVSEVDAEPDAARPDDQPGTTYLIVGSDSRKGLSPEERKRLGTGNAESRLADTILLLHTGSGPNLLLSFPRDSLVEVPGRGTTKINSSYSGGPRLVVRTIEENTGIRVDHYIEIGMGGVVNVVDAVGGVEICPKQAIQDKDAKLDIEKGCQEADGPTALGYARSRKTYATGDVQRGQAQREVISAVGGKAVSPWTVINPFRYWSLAFAAAGSVQVSEGTSAFTMGRFAMAMAGVSGDGDGLTCGVPIADLVVNWDEDRSRRMFDLVISDSTDEIPEPLCTPSGLPPGTAG